MHAFPIRQLTTDIRAFIYRHNQDNNFNEFLSREDTFSLKKSSRIFISFPDVTEKRKNPSAYDRSSEGSSYADGFFPFLLIGKLKVKNEQIISITHHRYSKCHLFAVKQLCTLLI